MFCGLLLTPHGLVICLTWLKIELSSNALLVGVACQLILITLFAIWLRTGKDKAEDDFSIKFIIGAGVATICGLTLCVNVLVPELVDYIKSSEHPPASKVSHKKAGQDGRPNPQIHQRGTLIAPKIENAHDPTAASLPANSNIRTKVPLFTSAARNRDTPDTGMTSGAESGPRRVFESSPPFPSFAREAGMQGVVTLAITFAPSGSVLSVRVTGTSGFKALDQYAADYVQENFSASPHSTTSTYSKRFNFRLR
jgi:TonB family protein